MTLLVVGQRMWARDNRWDGYTSVTVRKVGREWVHLSDGRRARFVGAYLGTDDGTWYVTDDGRAQAEARLAPMRLRGRICEAVGLADIETLNQIAALLGLPVVAAWTPEQT